MSSFNIFSPVLCITYEDADQTQLHSCGIAYSEAEALLLVKEQAIKYFNNNHGDGEYADQIAVATTSEQLQKELMALGDDGPVWFFFELNAQTLPCSYVCSIAYNDWGNHSHIQTTSVATRQQALDYIKNLIVSQVGTEDKADVQVCQDEEALLQVVQKIDVKIGRWFKWNIIAHPSVTSSELRRGQKHKLEQVKQDEAYQVSKKQQRQNPDLDGYLEIYRSWNNNASSNDVYHMVVRWCQTNIDRLDTSQKTFAKHILHLGSGNESSKRIVELFLAKNILGVNTDDQGIIDLTHDE